VDNDRMKNTFADGVISPEVLRPLTECAKVHGLSRSTLHDLLKNGSIAYLRLPGGERRIPDSAVRAWIERSLVVSASTPAQSPRRMARAS
jgi:excisionase family DNA binding protein